MLPRVAVGDMEDTLLKRNRWFAVALALSAAGQLALACTTSNDDDDTDAGAGRGGSANAGRGGMDGSDAGDGGKDAQGGTSGGTPGAGGSGGSPDAGTGGGPEAGAGGGGGGDPTVELIDCDSRAVTNATVVEDDIDEDTTWSGVVHLKRSITVVDDATLTIEPGTRIVAASGSGIEFGWNGTAVTLLAEGTADEPIRFCGQQDDPGYWRGIIVRSNVTRSSVLRHVLIADAGDDDYALSLEADVHVDDVQVRNSGSDGVLAHDFDEGSRALSVEGAAGYPIVFAAPDAVTNFPLGGVLENNESNFAVIDLTDIDDDATFHDLGIPYLQERALTIHGRGDIVFEAGVEYRLDADAYIEVGWNGTAPVLSVDGTSRNPVVFRGVREQAGLWAGLIVRSNVATDSALSHTVIRHAGGDSTSALHLEAPIKLDSVSLEDNAQGAWISEAGVHEDSKNLTITGTEAAPLTVEPNALVTLPQGGTFTGNDKDEILIEGGSYTAEGTVPNLGVPYHVLANIDTRTSRMVLTPGTHFLMGPDTQIEFGWNNTQATILAEGTEDEPIRFTGTDESPGAWTGLLLGGAVSSESKFDYVEIGHAVNGLRLAKPVPVTNSAFFECSEYGVLKDADDDTDYTETNTFTDMGQGNVGDI